MCLVTEEDICLGVWGGAQSKDTGVSQGLKIRLEDRVREGETDADKRSERKDAVLRNAWVEANYRGSKGRNVELWSHLAVQVASQLVNSGSEWTMQTLEGTERKVFPSAVPPLTMEGS